MKAIVGSMIEILNVTYEIQKFCEKELSFDNPEYIMRKKKRQPVFGLEKYVKAYIYDGMTGSIKVPRGFLQTLKEIEPNLNLKYTYKTFEDVDFGWNEKWILRDYQENAIADMYNESGVLISPAGSGKTLMAMKHIELTCKPTIWLTHTKDLMYQAKDRAEKVLLFAGEIGLIGDGHKSYGDKKLIIANFQTIQRSPEIISWINENIGLTVVDEAHHVPSSMFMDVISKINTEHMIGLTATPDRKDQMEFLLYLVVGPKLHKVERQHLYDNSQLIKPEIIFKYTDFEDDQTSKTNSNGAVNAGGEQLDYQYLLHKLYSDEDRLELIANTIFSEIQEGNFQLVLSESIDYAYKLQKRVIELIDENNYVGVETSLVHGGLVRYSWMVVESKRKAEEMYEDDLALDYKFDKRAKRWKVKIENYTKEEFRDRQISKKERQQILQRVVDRKVQILFATKLAKEGLDIPHLNIGHSVSSKRGDEQKRTDGNAIEQEIGRIMRPDPLNPNKVAKWYDYVDHKCGIFKTHYYSRRKVYKRLDLAIPKKLKTKMESVEEFLSKKDLFI